LWNQGRCELGSETDKNFKLRAVLRAHTIASQNGKHLGATIDGWQVRKDNNKTSADGLLRRESYGPLADVGSMATGSDFSIGQPPKPKDEGVCVCVVCCLVRDNFQLSGLLHLLQNRRQLPQSVVVVIIITQRSS